jgi:ribosomal protein S6
MSARKYKIISMLRPALSVEQATQFIKDAMSKVKTLTQHISIRMLAYPIDHNKTAHEIITDIECMPSEVLEIRRKLEIDENVLRVLVLRNEAKSLKFEQKEESIRAISSYLNRTGRISLPRSPKMPRRVRSSTSRSIKRYRFCGMMPFFKDI